MKTSQNTEGERLRLARLKQELPWRMLIALSLFIAGHIVLWIIIGS